MKEIDRFVVLAQNGRFYLTDRCEQFGISRKTGYQQMERSVALELARSTTGRLRRCHAAQRRSEILCHPSMRYIPRNENQRRVTGSRSGKNSVKSQVTAPLAWPRIFSVGLLVQALMLTACYAAGDNLSSMKAKDHFSNSDQLALAEAAARGKVRKIDELLKGGADINAQGKDNMTSLLWSMLKKNKAGFRHLLERGADPNVQTPSGYYVMSIAASADDLEYLDLLLSHGGDPNLVDSKEGITPIFRGIGSLKLANVRRLIAAGANLDFRDQQGGTPAIYAAIQRQYNMVYSLLEAGADPTIKDNIHESLGGYATEFAETFDPKSEGNRWRLKVIELLRAKGIPIK